MKFFGLAAALLFIVAMPRAFAQADALVDMLQKKGMLTQREANEVKEQTFKEIREQMPGTKIQLGGWLDEIKLYGDMRLRYEQFWDRRVQQTPSATVLWSPGTVNEQDRTRYRYRLRFGLEAKAGDWIGGFRLASGDAGGPTADPISTNTTMTNWASKKNINIDMAYIKYTPSYVTLGDLSMTVGKMENTFWETDMVYDGDLTPEGFAEQYKYKFGDRYSVFANLGQWVIQENNITGTTNNNPRGKDAYMFGYQVGHQLGIVDKKLDLKQAVAFYDYTGLWASQTNPGVATANSTVNNALAPYFGSSVLQNEFEVLSVNNELRLGYWEKYPIRLQGEYIHNFGNNVNGGDGVGVDGFKVGGILGEAKKRGQWQVGYWYEFLQANANPGIFSDSDFGNGGTNNKGHILKASYCLTDWASLGVAYWNVQNIEDVINSGASGSMTASQAQCTQRFQFDVNMKF
jgi:hypothetical protein